MHAASVHPEPGSNSQTNCISSAVSRSDSFELFILAFFTFLELCSVWFWQILFSHLLFALYFFYLLFNCQVSIRSLFSREPVYYITSLFSCQEVFQNFFKKLCNPKSRYFVTASSGNSYILPHHLLFVNTFFEFFSDLYILANRVA